MSSERNKKYSIAELVQASGVPRRTIRYYVQLGLLAPPDGAGRGHFYRPSHLEKLLRIRELQGSGHGLEEIRMILENRLDAPDEAPADPDIELVSRIRVGDGVDLVVSHGAEPPTPSQLRLIGIAVAQILKRR